jgi:hypothetical protein
MSIQGVDILEIDIAIAAAELGSVDLRPEMLFECFLVIKDAVTFGAEAVPHKGAVVLQNVITLTFCNRCRRSLGCTFEDVCRWAGLDAKSRLTVRLARQTIITPEYCTYLRCIDNQQIKADYAPLIKQFYHLVSIFLLAFIFDNIYLREEHLPQRCLQLSSLHE